MVKIASWNVNSIKARLPNVLDWIGTAAPDVLLMQEIKTQTDGFPRFEFEALGYHCAVVGQKSYNGVAVISKEPLGGVLEALPGEPEDEQARYLEATTFGLRLASIYLPNGNPPDSERYAYKLRWMERLRRHVLDLLDGEQAVVLGGDYNVIPAPQDAHDPAAWVGDALYLPETRRKFREILNLGLVEAFRALHPGTVGYTFWDYTGRAWQADNGIRIDHLLLSPQAADRLSSCDIDREPRGRDRASDHTPILCEVTP